MPKQGKSLRQRLKRAGMVLLFIIFSLLIVGLLAVEVFDRYLSSDSGAMSFYKKAIYEPIIHRTTSGLRYLELGDPEKQALVLLHGSPGSIQDWKSMVTDSAIFEQYRLIIPERPGYGATKPRRAEPSIVVQAERCLEVLKNESGPSVLMGYSYGAPVALVMAALAPDKISKVIGVSGQYNPDNEIVFKISHFIKFRVFCYIIPRWFWVSNVEKLAHQQSLKEVLPLFQKVKCDVQLLHGDDDSIVPYENSTWLRGQMGNRPSLQTLKGMDHGVPFNHMDVLIKAVLSAK